MAVSDCILVHDVVADDSDVITDDDEDDDNTDDDAVGDAGEEVDPSTNVRSCCDLLLLIIDML